MAISKRLATALASMTSEDVTKLVEASDKLREFNALLGDNGNGRRRRRKAKRAPAAAKRSKKEPVAATALDRLRAKTGKAKSPKFEGE